MQTPLFSAIRTDGTTKANITITMTDTAHPIKDVEENWKAPENISFRSRNENPMPRDPKNNGYPQL